MQIPQLNTNIDYSNALFKMATEERARQDQADLLANRNLQTQSLVENRQVENAFRQMQMNKEKAVLENTKLDTVHKMLATADPANEEDWKAFATFSEQHGSKIPVPVKTDGTFDSEVATKWRDNKLDAIAYMRTGNKDIDQINLIKENPDGTAETLVHYAKKKDKTSFDPVKEYGKGWKIVDKFVNPQDLEEKRLAREARIAAQKDPNRFAPQRVEAEDAEGNTVILSFPSGQTVTQADIETKLGPGATIVSSSDKKKKPVSEEALISYGIEISKDPSDIVHNRPIADSFNRYTDSDEVYALLPVTYSRTLGGVPVPGTVDELGYTRIKVPEKLPTVKRSDGSYQRLTKKDYADFVSNVYTTMQQKNDKTKNKKTVTKQEAVDEANRLLKKAGVK